MQRLQKTGALVSLCLLMTAYVGADTKCGCEGGDSFSKSIFAIQRSLPQFETGSPIRESMFHNDRMDEAENGYGGALQVTVFGGSSNDEEELARYFSPNCKSRLIVANQAAINHGAKQDIQAEHLNIRFSDNTTRFESVLQFCPEVDYVGAGLAWKQTLCRDDEDKIRWWFEASAPIINVETDMGLTESVRQGGDAQPLNTTGLNGDPVVSRAKQFFQQKGLKYGRIDNCEIDETQLGDIELKLGYNALMDCDCYLNSYLGIVIPTTDSYNEDECSDSRQNDFRQLLQPLAGTADHFGLMYGSHIGMHLRDFDQWSLRTAIDVHARYLFSNEELRSFDLKGKPWSRYMEFYESEQQAQQADNASTSDPALAQAIGTSGINLLTQCVDVTPGFDGRVNTAFIFERCNFAAELGFNTNYQQAEEIECARIKGNFALKAQDGQGETNIARTIQNAFGNEDGAVGDFQNNVVQTEDLDVSSASHPATLHHTIYGTLGYNFENDCVPGFVAVGGSYTLGATNNELENWGVWGKIGISF